jgi:hypothetical protein
MGTQSVSVLVDLNLALANCNIIVPIVDELSRCKTAQAVEDISIPVTNGLVGFKGLAIFHSRTIFPRCHHHVKLK